MSMSFQLVFPLNLICVVSLPHIKSIGMEIFWINLLQIKVEIIDLDKEEHIIWSDTILTILSFGEKIVDHGSRSAEDLTGPKEPNPTPKTLLMPLSPLVECPVNFGNVVYHRSNWSFCSGLFFFFFSPELYYPTSKSLKGHSWWLFLAQ